MSFCSDVKSELCSHRPDRHCCRRAEGHGLSLGLRIKKDGCASIKTSSSDVAAFALNNFGKLFDAPFNVKQSGNGFYSVDSMYPIASDDFLFTPQKDCCRVAYIRGAFLACGQLTNPGSTCRIDFNLRDTVFAEHLVTILSEAGFLPSVSIKSSGKATVYFKKSSMVEDLLTYMGAPVSTLDLMEIRVEKDYKNHINRAVNFETANYVKTYGTGEAQVSAILSMKQSGMLDSLDDELKRIAELRLNNPDSSLKELAELSGLSRSTVNRRMNKLIGLSGEKRDK